MFSRLASASNSNNAHQSSFLKLIESTHLLSLLWCAGSTPSPCSFFLKYRMSRGGFVLFLLLPQPHFACARPRFTGRHGRQRFIQQGMLGENSTNTVTTRGEGNHRPRRRLQKNLILVPEVRSMRTMGVKRLLAVRVTSTFGEEPEESLDAIQGAIFGSGRNPDAIPPHANVVAQYAAISHGQLQFVPAEVDAASSADAPLFLSYSFHNSSGETTPIKEKAAKGVLEITVDAMFNGSNIHEMTDVILTTTQSAFGGRPLSDVADNFIFCLPTGGLYNGIADWTAFSYLLEAYSYYQKSRCTRLSVVMHEIGHSLGFQHSGSADGKYGDKTDYMGFTANVLGKPLKGFNAHKHWISGWFNSRTLDVDPSVNGTIRARLIAFVHPSSSSGRDTALVNDAYLMRVGHDLYLQYNRAKGYNVDAHMPDTVTVTKASAPDSVSHRLAALSTGQRFVYTNDEQALIIEVCTVVSSLEDSSLDYANVIIRIGSESSPSACGEVENVNATPTSAPALSPTSSPVPLLDDILKPQTPYPSITPPLHQPVIPRNHSDTRDRHHVVDAALWSLFAALSICLLIAVYAFFVEIKWLDRNKLPINHVARYVQRRRTGRCLDKTQKTTTCETEDETSACQEPTEESMDEVS